MAGCLSRNRLDELTPRRRGAGEPGRHNAELSGENLPSGLYICVLQAASRVAARKLVLLK